MNQDASDCVLGLFGKLSTKTSVHHIWTCSAKVL